MTPVLSEPVLDGPVRLLSSDDGAVWRLILSTPKSNVLDAAKIAALTVAFQHARDNRGVKAMGDQYKELQDMAAKAGRGTIPVSMFGAPAEPTALEQLEKDGVTRAIFTLPPEGVDTLMPILDQMAEVKSKVA